MLTILLALSAFAAIILIAIIVNRVTGTVTHYIDEFERDGNILWKDAEADVYVIPRLGKALFNSYARMRRSTVIVFEDRIITGTRPLFGKRPIVMHVISLSRENAPAVIGTIGGGFLGRGYQTFLAASKSISKHTEEKKSYVEISLDPGAASSLNVDVIRIYTDRAAQFPDG